jgi:hypothetical protein
MDYKVIIADEDVEEALILDVFANLQQIVIDQKNIDLNNPSPFIVEGQEAVLIGTTWGVNRPDVEDMEELSRMFPELTFYFMQASKILNANHFEDLTNYSMSLYQDGELREIFKPETIVWKSVKVIEFLESPWTS